MRLLTDTCAAMKLFAFGNKLFQPGVLKSGDLVIHARVFNETRKWPPYKKQKYQSELKVLATVRATPNLNPNDPAEAGRIKEAIAATASALQLPIGSAD